MQDASGFFLVALKAKDGERENERKIDCFQVYGDGSADSDNMLSGDACQAV